MPGYLGVRPSREYPDRGSTRLRFGANPDAVRIPGRTNCKSEMFELAAGSISGRAESI